MHVMYACMHARICMCACLCVCVCACVHATVYVLYACKMCRVAITSAFDDACSVIARLYELRKIVRLIYEPARAREFTALLSYIYIYIYTYTYTYMCINFLQQHAKRHRAARAYF